jgi:hypothetical protein
MGAMLLSLAFELELDCIFITSLGNSGSTPKASIARQNATISI